MGRVRWRTEPRTDGRTVEAGGRGGRGGQGGRGGRGGRSGRSGDGRTGDREPGVTGGLTGGRAPTQGNGGRNACDFGVGGSIGHLLIRRMKGGVIASDPIDTPIER